MTSLLNDQKENDKKSVMQEDHVMNAHQFLMEFLAKFDTAKRGGIHDFMEIALYNMINHAIGEINSYLANGHKSVNANEIMIIFADSCQKILDNIKRNLEKMDQVNLK